MNKATLVGMVAIFLWSTSVAMVRSTSENLGHLNAMCLICFSTGLLGLLYLVLKKNWKPAHLKRYPKRYLYLAGGSFVLYMSFLTLALGLCTQREQVLQVGLLNYLWPLTIILFSIILLKFRATMLLIPGLFLALTGIYFILSKSLDSSPLIQQFVTHPTPYLLGVACGVLWGFYSVLVRKWHQQGESLVPIFFLISGFFLFVLTLLFPSPMVWTPQVFLELVFYILGPGTIAYMCWEKGMKSGDIEWLASFSYVTPILSTLINAYYLRSWPTPILWMGCLFLSLGAFLCKFAVKETSTTKTNK